MKKHALTIGWLYPELMSTYGDRGNIIVLTRRCEWRDIKISLEKISIGTNVDSLKKVDLLFMGGAQDTQQEIVNKDLFERKGNTLRKLIGDSVPGLFICGAYQFLGRYYKTAEGKKLPGLEIFPSYTENPGEKHKRLISNIIIEKNKEKYVGFENHGGRTYLDDPQTAFGTVIKGFGNNGTDKTEGIIFKNSIGTYLHGPILPKNPTLRSIICCMTRL
jgi:CobQ-like glutamine amidotransferase family enzyme